MVTQLVGKYTSLETVTSLIEKARERKQKHPDTPGLHYVSQVERCDPEQDDVYRYLLQFGTGALLELQTMTYMGQSMYYGGILVEHPVTDFTAWRRDLYVPVLSSDLNTIYTIASKKDLDLYLEKWLDLYNIHQANIQVQSRQKSGAAVSQAETVYSNISQPLKGGTRKEAVKKR